jgi:hypothetical protein
MGQNNNITALLIGKELLRLVINRNISCKGRRCSISGVIDKEFLKEGIEVFTEKYLLHIVSILEKEIKECKKPYLFTIESQPKLLKPDCDSSSVENYKQKDYSMLCVQVALEDNLLLVVFSTWNNGLSNVIVNTE